MRTFLMGLAIAVILTAGTAYLFQAAEVTVVERSSPSQWVRIDADASQTAKGTGYGTPKKDKKAETETTQPEPEKTANR